MKTRDYRRLAAGAALDALRRAGDVLGPVTSVKVDGEDVALDVAREAFGKARAGAADAARGGPLARSVDASAGRAARSMSGMVDSFQASVREGPIGKLITPERQRALRERMKIDPERVSSKTIVEVRFATGHREPFAVEAVNLGATLTLQRASLAAEAASTIVPIVGPVFPAATALACFAGAASAAVRGDWPQVKAMTATATKQALLTGAGLLPIEPITPLAAVVDARNLEALKREPTVAQVVHLGTGRTPDGLPIVPESVPRLALSRSVRRLLADALPAHADGSPAARAAFLRAVSMLEKSGALEKPSARTLSELVEEWGGFTDLAKWRTLLAQAHDRRTAVATGGLRHAVSKLAKRVSPEVQPELDRLFSGKALRHKRLSDVDRTNVLRILAAHADRPDFATICRSVGRLLESSAFRSPRLVGDQREVDTRLRMLRLISTLAELSHDAEPETAQRARASLDTLLSGRLDWDLTAVQAKRAPIGGFERHDPPAWRAWWPGTGPRVSLDPRLVGVKPTRVSAPTQRKLVLDAVEAALAAPWQAAEERRVRGSASG